MVSVMCLTTTGGMPLFNRSHGNIDTFSFSSMASLNGVHMYGKSHNMLLKSTATEDMTIVWQEFENSITLITAGVTLDVQTLSELSQAVFNTLVMFVGIEELRNVKNVERLRKDLRMSFATIEKLLQAVDLTDTTGPNSSLLNYTAVMLPPDPELLQSYVDTWSECVASMFCCVIIEGSLAAASSGWWQLDRVDRYLLSLVIPSSDASTSSDVPVFLPVKSPTVPFRLVSCTPMQGIRIVALCGPVPDLYQFEQLAIQAWKSAIDLLNDCAALYPRNIALSFAFHESVLGFLLIDDMLGKMAISGTVSGHRKPVKCPSHILRSFYYQCVHDMVVEKDENGKQTEIYWCAEHYKTFAVRDQDTILCLLFSSVVPTHAMRVICKETLVQISQDKSISW
uniref:Protein fuzzy homolog n=1 Tax=Cacopsylla melanoneura TaxID=428564 RepID=A0A8D9E0S7_9HEMI